jgi:hypothetical protein
MKFDYIFCIVIICLLFLHLTGCTTYTNVGNTTVIEENRVYYPYTSIRDPNNPYKKAR